MANREQRSNREKKKPKAEKPKGSAAQASSFGRPTPADAKAGKKAR